MAFDPAMDRQGTAPKQQGDARQTQHSTPVPTGSGEGSDVSSAPGHVPEELDEKRHIAALIDVADRAFQYAEEAANGAERALSRSSTRNEERLETVMHAAHAHWLVAERHYGSARDAHANGQKSRLAYHASEAVSAAVETQRTAGVATTAHALREVLEGLSPPEERARQAELSERLEAELDRELTAVTRMDAASRDRLQGARWHAESAVPELGWWPALAADMAHASQGRLWLDETGTSRLLRKTADGRGVAGRKVDADRVAMLRAAGFLVTDTESETSTPLHPSDMGREALYLATLYPEGLYADARAAYEARYEQSRRSWMNNEDRKSAARRLPPLDRYAMRAVREKPVLLEDDQVPQISTEDIVHHPDMADLAQRLGRWAAISHGEKFDVNQAPGTAGTQEPEALAGELGQDDVGDARAAAAPSIELPPAPGQNTPLAGKTPSTTTRHEAGEEAHPTADNPAAMGLSNPAFETTAPPPHKPSGGTTPSPSTTPLARVWALALTDVGAPHSIEAATAAWALRGVLADSALIELMAALDDDAAFARWKSQHMPHYGEGTGYVNKDLAPGESVSHKHGAKHFEARIGDQTVKVTWDSIRAWLREAVSSDALSLLQAAEEAGARLRGGSRGDSLLEATGELALARDLRAQVERLTTQVLDHITQFMATTPVPTGGRGKQSARAAADSLFDLNEPLAFDLPGADKVRADLDRLNDYLPAPHAPRAPDAVPLSQVTVGTVLDVDDRPIVVTEIIRHDGRCDVIGEFRDPIRPARIKHSVDLSGQAPDPLLKLAPVLPSLHTLTGRRPEPYEDHVQGPLVVGHPARSAPAASRAHREAGPPVAPPAPRLLELTWDKERRQAHGQALTTLAGQRPPLSAARRALEPDDPYTQFTDNLAHQLHQLTSPDERTVVADGAQKIREAAADLATRARAYSTERVQTADGDAAQLLQITMEPSLADPFVQIAMNTIMRVTDAAEASVTGAAAQARVRAALAAVVCSDPPNTPSGDSPREFGDALIEIQAVASHTRDTVAELLAGPAQWAHFADMSARVEAATATPDPSPPPPRFVDVDELRAHLADLAQRPLPDIEADPAGLIRYELRDRATFAGHLADEPTLELTPSRRLAIYGSAKNGWHVVAPGSANAIVPWSVKTRRHALRYAALLERLTDTEGHAYPWDADDFPHPRTPYEPGGGHLLYDWVQSNQSHRSLGFRHRLRVLREDSGAYRWMENLALYGFESFDYLHPASPADLMPGDEVMFTFDQDELEYASSLAGYFPPLQGGDLAIGTAVVGGDGELIPGFWWPEGHPGQAQRLTKDVALREGVRRARPGEYSLHAGITKYLPEHTQQQAPTPGMMTGPSAQPETPQAETDPAPDAPAPVPISTPESGWRQHAQLTEVGDLRRTGLHSAPPPVTVEADLQEQPALFAVPEPTASPVPADALATAEAAALAAGAEAEAAAAALPRYSRERHQALVDVARGTISVIDGEFMLTNPRRPIRKAPSQQHLRTVLNEALAHEVDGQVHLSDRGVDWFAHHKLTPPAVARSVETVEQAPLPPIDYAPLDVLPAPKEQHDGPRPPAPTPLPDNWHRRYGEPDDDDIQATLAMAEDATRRKAQSTARDVADLAAGPDHALWTHQHPLAQFDENAAAALETVTDPRTRDYANRAVLHLRTALVEAGRRATDHYVSNVRSPEWRTIMGRQSDDVHRTRVRGIVISYLIELRTHAVEQGLDADTIIHVLEDATGWTGDLRPLGLKAVEYPHLPAAESVAEAAQHVANALLFYARGETETVDTRAERRAMWLPVGPRPDQTASPAAEDPQEGAGGLLAGDETPPGPDAAADVKERFDRRFDLRYRVGQFVDHRDDNGQTVTARVVSDTLNPVLRAPDGHEFRAFSEYRRNNFLQVLADDGSDLPAPAWTASLPEGQRAVPPSTVRPGDVMHDYRENGQQWTSRLVIEVKEQDGGTTLTCVGLEKFSGLWVHYDHRRIAVLDETEQSRQRAEAALKGREVRAFAKAFGISLAGVLVSPSEAARAPLASHHESEQPSAEPQAPASVGGAAAASPGERVTDTEAAAPTASASNGSPAPFDSQTSAQDRAAPDPDGPGPRRSEHPTGPRLPQHQGPAAPASAPATPTRAEPQSAAATTGGLDSHAAPVEPEPGLVPADGEGGAPGSGADAQGAGVVADMPANRTDPVLANRGDSPPPSPAAAVRKEGTVATSTPSSAGAAEESVASVPTEPKRSTTLEPATAYVNAAAYAVGHEALLGELDRHERWLANTPAAAEAAAILADDSTLGPESLTALLALHRALTPTADQADDQRPHLVQRLAHHIRCAQLTLSKRVFGQAARSTQTDRLRELHQMAFQGGFITFREQTEVGELELGQYLHLRAQQLTQHSADTEGHAAETPAMTQEVPTVAADPEDDIQLPVFEMPGESIMTAEEAAPRLLAQVRTHLAAARVDVELLAHVHGSPIYATVDQAGTPAAALHLGLTAVGEEGSPRAVTLREEELAVVAPETLLTAVTAWMNATDFGDRPLLDYAPSTSAQTPLSATSDPSPRREGEHTPEEPAATVTPIATAPATSQPTPAQSPQETAERPEPVASKPNAAPQPVPAAPPAVATSAGGRGRTASPLASTTRETQATLSLDADADADAPSPQPAAAVSSIAEQQDDEARQAEKTPAPLTDRPAPPETEPVAELTTLARAALTELGFPAEATGILTAPRTVVLTLETSGNAERDREISDNLRAALTQAVRQHPDQGLAAYRIDIERTQQVGQYALSTGTPAPQTVPVPRERLVAANNAAAAILTERLRTDPNAALARTYLGEERHLSTEIQQEWGLGYAPSDRGAGRFDVLVRELTAEGFTEDELLQAGLAMRSRRGKLIDYLDDRIVFPIHDEHGDIVGFSGRRIDRPGETKEETKARQSQKYFNTSNQAPLFSKGDLVFGLHHPAQAQALAGSSGPRISVEGYFDVIAVARAAATLPLDQRPVVGAPMGTAFTERQLTVLRGLDTDEPRPHIAFLDADDSGRKVLLDKWDLLLKAAGPTMVTTAPGAKDAANLWEEGIEADGDGTAPVLHALAQRQPLLDAAVEAVLVGKADEGERARHAFGSDTSFQRKGAIAAEAARYIRQWVQTQAPGDTSALEQAALTWATRLHQEWSIPGYMTATAVLLGPGNHHEDYENEVYQQALDLLAAHPEGYFANDSHVRSRQSAAPPGQWPAGSGASGPVPSTGPAAEPAPASEELGLSMFLPSPVDRQPVEHTDRTTAAYALHTAVHERLGQHAAETPEPDRLPQPLNLGTIHGVDLGTSGDDQTGEDPTVVVWLGPARSDSLRLSYSRLVEMTGPELLAAVEWRAAQAAGLLGAPLSQTWRDAVRSILPLQFPAQPTPAQVADLLDTIAQGPDADDERTRHRAEQAISLYTAGHPDLALNHLAGTDHIWVLRNDGSWIEEEAVDTELSWEELDNGFSKEAAELADVAQAAAALPPGNPAPLPVDLTVAHHSAHEALAVLRPYSIGLPNTCYEKITDLVAQMDASQPALRRLHGPDGKQLMNRARTSFVRILEGLATVASKIRLTGLSARIERTVARLRGQDPAALPAQRAVRVDRRMQDLAHIERDLERRMAEPTTTLDERGELQEQWIINRARRRARYEQLHGQPPGADFLPDNGLVAGAPPVPNLVAAHDLLLNRLSTRVDQLRDTDPHTGEASNPYDPTADVFNGVAWAYQQRLVGAIPAGEDPQGSIPAAQLRHAALTVTSHQQASPLTLRRTLNVTGERADRLLHRLEKQQILGPYRADAPRTVLARPGDIDALLARPATPSARRKPAAEPTAAPTTAPGPDALDETRIQKMVSKILADQHKRTEAHGEPDPAERTAPATRVRKSAHSQAEAHALAAGQPTSLAPSQP
ncbi:toprim domain-containing protein [Streptomyces sp. NPDC058371]|uniref:toprim domain-containing protein n=1 Tax=Streptomyces sp. NPDC058371 TaxID=3346463 RepID=UPI0036537EA8